MQPTTKSSMVVLLSLAFASGTAGGDTAFQPVTVQTEPLTMTGMRAPEPEAQPRDFVFTPVHVTTETLTMTGMRD